MTENPSTFGRVGLWAGFLDQLPASEAIAAVRAIEAAGVTTIWLQEFSGIDPFVRAGLYLTATTRLAVALGVAVVYARDPEAMVSSAWALEESFPGRFVLGLGVSHRAMVESRGHVYGPPVPMMKAYLESMDRAVRRRRLPLRVLGALGPKMVDLAGTAADGAHTYFGPVAHTGSVRAAIGPDRWLAPTQMVALLPDDGGWREGARNYLQMCLGMTNYTNNLQRFGFNEVDFTSTSDRLLDALVVPDEPASLEARIDEQHSAGADHLVLQFIPPPPARVVLARLEKGYPISTA